MSLLKAVGNLGMSRENPHVALDDARAAAELLKYYKGLTKVSRVSEHPGAIVRVSHIQTRGSRGRTCGFGRKHHACRGLLPH
jgi:hypothetical protein